MAAFDQAFAIVLGAEGGYVNNPADPGGVTKFGISQRSYPSVDIAALTVEGAKVIYKRDYWDRVRGDDLPPTLALLVFDAAVNNGPGAAAKWLQTACGARIDGMIGPGTLAAVQGHAGHGAEVCAEFQAQRLTFMAGLPTWHTFGLGWARRLCRLPYQTALMTADPVAAPAPVQTRTVLVDETEALNEASLTNALNQRGPQ